jgi:histidine ammonia-lyase
VLHGDALARLERSRGLVDQAVAAGETIYGINTGFGKLANVRVPAGQLDQLQVNLIRSHAAGVGSPLWVDAVRAAMLLRANVLLRPTSGVRPALVEALVALLNAGIVPRVPEQGSVGASGDLAPLSHIAMVLLGEGEVLGGDGRAGQGTRGGRPQAIPFRSQGRDQLHQRNPGPDRSADSPGSRCRGLVADRDRCCGDEPGGAAGNSNPARSTNSRGSAPSGQLRAAELMRDLLADSEIRESHRENDPRVQDAYSLRCTPQVMGAVADAIRFARETARIELNASTDNPLVFEDGSVLSGGNFHGQPVAQALDFLAIALTTLQAISERRVERLVNPDLSQGLPAFLTRDPGLSSGFMMVQITAASLVAESRSLSHPASPGSIPTDANQEDFVPMGMAAAFKASRILANAQRVVAAELLCAAQGLEFLGAIAAGTRSRAPVPKGAKLGDGVPLLEADRPPAPDLERLASLIARGNLDPAPGLAC